MGRVRNTYIECLKWARLKCITTIKIYLQGELGVLIFNTRLLLAFQMKSTNRIKFLLLKTCLSKKDWT